MRDHEKHRDDAGAYLLGALPELEAQAFERHVMGCAACRDEVERLRAAAEALPRAVPQVAPSSAVRERVMAEVRADAAGGAETARAPRARAWRLPRIPRVRPAMAWVSAAVIILAGVLAGYGLSSLADDDDAGSARTLAAQVDRTRAPEASASLLVPGRGGVAVLSVHGLRRPTGSQVYVVWVQRGDERIFESSFNVRPDGSGKAAVESLEGVDRVMVTRERSAGVVAPTEAPLLTVATG